MSKQITATELAEIVTQLLTNTAATGELESAAAFQGFMTDIAKVVCDYCGGEVRNPADPLEDIWYVGIHGNCSLPDAEGGIWKGYDKEGALFEDNSPQGYEARYGTEHPAWPQSVWYAEVLQGNTKLGYWAWVAHSESGSGFGASLPQCPECGTSCETLVGCPDGAEICPDCFNHGRH